VTEIPSLDPAIRAYYEQGREEGRLQTSSRLEFIRTQELLHRFLQPPPAKVLDIGGGAGAHAKPLIVAGYDVVLVDPVALHVDQARAAGIEQAELGDARHLKFDDGTFDAALVLGPLYHLTDRAARVRAIEEASRVVHPTGLVLAAVICRFASTFDGLYGQFLEDDRFERIVERDLATGHHENHDSREGWFTTAYFHHPAEIHTEFADAGCEVKAVLAIEGPAACLSDVDSWLDDEKKCSVLMRAIRRVEAEPSLLGASSHILVVATPAPY